MSYPIQKIVAATIADLMPGQYSCCSLAHKVVKELDRQYGSIWLPLSIEDTVKESILYEYHIMAKPNVVYSGFAGADHYSQELFNYRLEMLYYFWMANQEM